MIGPKLGVFLEDRYVRAPDQHIYTAGAHNKEFFYRYKTAFSKVCVVARSCDGNVDGLNRVTDSDIHHIAIPNYRGLGEFLSRRRNIDNNIASAVAAVDVVVARLPGYIGGRAAETALREGKPLGLEIVGDPLEALRWVPVSWPVRTALRLREFIRLRRLARRADGVAYVTRAYLQRRYPTLITPTSCRFETNYSSVALPAERPKHSRLAGEESQPRIICVAGMDQWYKGHDTLIAALAICHRKGLTPSLTLVGDGPLRTAIGRLVERHNLKRFVFFRGKLSSGNAVLEELASHDFFVLPSRTEGLPRALIEAMWMGLPCLASSVGGCSELLPSEFLFRPGSAKTLAEKLSWMCSLESRFPSIGRAMAQRTADYTEPVLSSRRDEFYAFLKQLALNRSPCRSDM